MTIFSKPKWLILVYHSVDMVVFVYDIGCSYGVKKFKWCSLKMSLFMYKPSLLFIFHQDLSNVWANSQNLHDLNGEERAKVVEEFRPQTLRPPAQPPAVVPKLRIVVQHFRIRQVVGSVFS